MATRFSQRWGKTLFFLTLTLALFTHNIFSASGTPLNLDEETGAAEAYDFRAGELFVPGLGAELSPSPLHYAVDRAFFLAAPRALRTWNASLWLRLLPSAYLALALSALFSVGLWMLAPLGAPTGASIFFTLATLFLLQVSEPMGWMRRDRPYALWFLCASLLLLCLKTLSESGGARGWRRLGFVSLAAALANYGAAMSLVPLYAALALAFRDRGPRWLLARLAGALPAASAGAAYALRGFGNAKFPLADGAWRIGPGALTQGTLSYVALFGDAAAVRADSRVALGAFAAALTLTGTSLFLAGPRKAAVYYGLGSALALPASVGMGYWVARNLQPWYLVPAYPALLLLRFAGVAGIAGRAASLCASRPMARAVLATLLVAWPLSQLALNLGPLGETFSREWSSAHLDPLHVRAPLEGCPESPWEFRHSAKGALDTLRLRDACLLGRATTAPLDDPLGYAPSSRWQKLPGPPPAAHPR